MGTCCSNTLPRDGPKSRGSNLLSVLKLPDDLLLSSSEHQNAGSISAEVCAFLSSKSLRSQ